MDINELLQGHKCSCGKFHTCPIKYVFIEKNAEKRLNEILNQNEKILIVADENTFSAAGNQVVEALAEKDVKKVIFPGNEILVPDEKAIKTVEDNIGDSTAIVGIGSGVIQDLCKYVSMSKKVPYVIVATAPSMDGYASDGAAMILGGMKVTVKAGLPMAILADPAVLKSAPMDMIRSGYGDIIGKFSALNDWEISRCINDEYFCKWIYDITMEQVKRTISLAKGITERNETAVAALMEALVIVGIMMSFAGSSRPASGSEHHLSHFFEITGILGNKPYLSHGIDVAYSTVVTAGLREKIVKNSLPDNHYVLSSKEYEDEMNRVYSSSAKGCMELQKKVGNYDKDRSPIYKDKWDEIKEILSKMPTAAEIEDILSVAGYDMEKFYAFYGKDKISDAVKWAKDLKDRFTVLWVNYDLYDGEI